ncbi:hypothetical protein O4328_43650 [Rhodococcus opacus]|uniref:Uncharacterized protein n=1 Tax=Rhodococcus opacus TaxID=37919 RepID=A0AAX3YP00_RHOOP|nr:hypothetical protein [Rhodococcus opacus]MCZ4590437.1 hypothetical protein [Rhodococcus opacus]WLF51267.1 hypothetical protein Q5707_38540 [Rhodococcus opacus]
MAPTDLSTVEPPEACTQWVLTAQPQDAIVDHAITVNLTWWNDALRARELPGGPVTGRNTVGETVDLGRAIITRGDVFAIAAESSGSPTDTLRLLWHTLAWGAGGKVRQVLARMDAVARDRSAAALALRTAATLSRTDPRSAYDTLYPRGRTVIAHLGPSFFTKYLYFAGAGYAGHPCLILDRRVAAALGHAGWNSLHPAGGWPAETYERYCALLARWGRKSAEVRPDLFERWLFDNGGAG